METKMDNLKNVLPIHDRIERDALKYERYKDQLNQVNPVEIDLFRSEVNAAFNRIFTGNGVHTETGYLPNSLTFETAKGNPYTSLNALSADIMNNSRLVVSSDNNNSQLLPNDLNLYFRATHDYLHYLYQKPFDFAGEYDVYKAQKLFHSNKIGRKILYSEIVLQAAYCTYFGKFSDAQKVIIY